MSTYSLDLRERVISMLNEDAAATQPDVAEHFQVSLSTVEKWWRRWRETETVAPFPNASGAPRTLEPCQAVIRQTLSQQPDATLQELCDVVHTATGVRASPSMMCRELQLLNLPGKKSFARQSTRNRARSKTEGRTPR